MVTDPEIQLSLYLIIHNPIANRHPCPGYSEFATAFQTKNELALYRGAKARQRDTTRWTRENSSRNYQWCISWCPLGDISNASPSSGASTMLMHLTTLWHRDGLLEDPPWQIRWGNPEIHGVCFKFVIIYTRV